MTRESAVRFLCWCAAGNGLVMLVWFGMLAFGKDFAYGLHSRWFNLTREQFDAVHYSLIGAYKLLFLFFNLIPLLALWLSS